MHQGRGSEKFLRDFISTEVTKVIKEDYSRGIPDFALSEIASEACESLKRYMSLHIQTVASDPAKQRQMFIAASFAVDELKAEMKTLLEDKLQVYLRKV